MAISLKHSFTSPISDNADPNQVQPSHWNGEHNLTLDTGNVVGRTTAGNGAAEEISMETLRPLVSGVPAGTIAAFAGTSAPTNWLLCYGQNVSRTTYAALFAVIGTTYGVGDGSTTFGLPDLRGRVIAGQDDMGGVSANRLTGASGGVDGDILGAAGGSETHTLTEAELAVHDHSVNPPNTTSAGNSGNHYHSWSDVSNTGSANHTHTLPRRNDLGAGSRLAANSSGSGSNATTSSSGSAHTHSVGGNTSNQIGSHTHTVDIVAFNSVTAGSGSAHNNVQPTFILNYIIKT